MSVYEARVWTVDDMSRLLYDQCLIIAKAVILEYHLKLSHKIRVARNIEENNVRCVAIIVCVRLASHSQVRLAQVSHARMLIDKRLPWPFLFVFAMLPVSPTPPQSLISPSSYNSSIVVARSYQSACGWLEMKR